MLQDYQTLVPRFTRADADDVKVLDVDDALRLAVSRYSKDRPRRVVEDVAAPGGQVLDLPTAWVPGFSDIQQIEYPVGDVPPNLLESWEIYQAPATESVLIPESIDGGATVRITFTVFHTLDDSTDTIPVVDREAVASYAAALLCDQLAAQYAGDGDSTIQADTVDHGGKSREFGARARTLRKRYTDAIGVDDKSSAPAGVVVDWDNQNSLGHDRLLHTGRRR